MVSEALIFNAVIEISRLVNNVLSLINSGADPEIAKAHFQTISRIAAENAAKPSIDGVSLHE